MKKKVWTTTWFAFDHFATIISWNTDLVFFFTLNKYKNQTIQPCLFCQEIKIKCTAKSSVLSLHRLHWSSSAIEDRLSLKVIFHHKESSVKGCLPSKVVSHQRSSSIKGLILSKVSFIKYCLRSKVVFNQRPSSIKCCLHSKVIFHQWSSFIKCCLQSKVIFHQRVSSIKGHLLSKVVASYDIFQLFQAGFGWYEKKSWSSFYFDTI